MSSTPKIINPQTFPLDAQGLHRAVVEKFRLNQRKHWFYTNEKGEAVFVVYRVDLDKPDNLGRSKVYYPGTVNNGKPCDKFMWTRIKGWKRPLFKLHELVNTTLDIIVVEGESAVESARKIFKDKYFVTCFYGGVSNWKKSDWSVLRGRRVLLWRDCDKEHDTSKKQFEKLAKELDKLGADAELINIPEFKEIQNMFLDDGIEYKKKSWDVADQFPKCLDPFEMVQDTYIVEREFEVASEDYTNIKEDRKNNRFLYLKHSDAWYDTKEKEVLKPKILDNMYLRDEELVHEKPKLTACTFLQQTNCKYVDSVVFKPGKPEVFEEDGKHYLNKYKPPKFSKIENPDYDISFWKHHILEKLCDGDEEHAQVIHDTLAWDLRNPGGNRKYAIILSSEEGLGKDLFFTAIKKLYGEENCEDLLLGDLTERFKPWAVESNYLFLGEVKEKVVRDNGVGGVLKKIVTDNKFRFECYKGIDSIRINSFYTIWMSSNETIPIRANTKTRRYYLIESFLLPERDILAEDPDYFIELGVAIDDPKYMANIYHYYKYDHKISENYHPHRTASAEAFAEIEEASNGEYIRYIDRIFKHKADEIDSFKFDLINLNKLSHELADWSREDDAWGGKKLNIDYNKVLYWVRKKKNPGLKVSKQALRVDAIDDKEKVRLWCIRNQKDWKKYIKGKSGYDLETLINSHFSGELTMGFQEKLDDNKKEVL